MGMMGAHGLIDLRNVLSQVDGLSEDQLLFIVKNGDTPHTVLAALLCIFDGYSDLPTATGCMISPERGSTGYSL